MNWVPQGDTTGPYLPGGASPPWGLKRCNLSNFTLASALLASGAMRFGARKCTIGQLREFVRNNQVTLRARSGDGVLQKLRTRNPDQAFNKPEKRWYSWMRNKRRTAKEKAYMEELNALVNYSAGHMNRTIEEAMGEAVKEASCAERAAADKQQQQRASAKREKSVA